MKQPRSFFIHVLIFVLAQMAWLIVLGLWIYWYVSNYMFISEVGEGLPSQLMTEGLNHLVLVGGIVLLIAVSTGMSMIFHRLSVQFKLTRLYDNFIANMTHELKSPLAAVQLSLETMKVYSLSREKQDEFITLMLKDTQRLNNLINAILQIPALEQKRIAHDFRVWTMGPLVQDLIQEIQEQFNLASEAIQLSGVEEECTCLVDRNALRIVMDNLVDNSIKYSQGQVQIKITCACQSRWFTLVYTDQGVGIAQQEQKKVFHKFYRSQDEHMPNVKGTGLGLYWAQEIIKYHQGTIRVDSQGKNFGTSFVIDLPLYPQEGKRSLKYLFGSKPKGKRKQNRP
ncbi:MAG: HAMP domain-containing sensor histidine kinase [Desulfovermiculus sp.]|nr:HAMP domain-containing sensor histidine kinase [Desulfovermiculus sp.]